MFKWKLKRFNKYGKGTFAASFINESEWILHTYFIQFSFIEPWYKPHKEYRYDGAMLIYGWLWFYIGLSTIKKDDVITTKTCDNCETIDKCRYKIDNPEGENKTSPPCTGWSKKGEETYES